MDRLVEADVKDLKLVFIRNHESSVTFELTNLMHTMPVVVFLDTTNPFRFSFTHPFAVIPPLSAATFTLVANPSCLPPFSATPDTVLVRSSIIFSAKTDKKTLHRVFSESGPNIYLDATIPISFVGPEFIDYLFSNPSLSETVDIELLLLKSASFCDRSELNSLLRSAVRSGNLLFVKSLVKAGADVNNRDVNGESIISLAILSGNVDVVRFLIGSRFEIDHSVDRVLHDVASVYGLDIMEVLCMSYLDIDVNSVDSQGQTALHIGANLGFTDALQFLTTLGSDPNVVDKNGWTPLHCASSKGHVSAVELLLSLSTYVKYAVTNVGKTAADLAFENDHSELYDMLRLGDVLHRAATINDVNGLNKCLAKGVNVNGKDQNGWTALHRAAFKGRVESVKVLLDHGARVDLVDNSGCTPLDRAVEASHGHVAMLLVSRRVRVRTKSLIDPMGFDFRSSMLLEFNKLNETRLSCIHDCDRELMFQTNLDGIK